MILINLFMQVLLRMLVSVQSPLRIVVNRPTGEAIEVDDAQYTFKHTVVFETQMKPPAKFKSTYRLENYLEWYLYNDYQSNF